MFVLQESSKHASNLQSETVISILAYTLLIIIFIALDIYIIMVLRNKKRTLELQLDNIYYMGPSKDCEIIGRQIHNLIDAKGYATIHDFYAMFKVRYYPNSMEHQYGWTSKDIWAFEIHIHRTKKWILKCPRPRRIKGVK